MPVGQQPGVSNPCLWVSNQGQKVRKSSEKEEDINSGKEVKRLGQKVRILGQEVRNPRYDVKIRWKEPELWS
jgi:hypothetical protein